MSDPESPVIGTLETANLHLDVLGESCDFPVVFPLGKQEVRVLLPIAQELTHRVTAVALESARRGGRTVSCRAGCGACCRQLVAVSFVEAQAVAAAVAAMPPARQAEIRSRFAEAIRRLEVARLLDPNEPKGARPLLDTGANSRLLAVPAVSRRYFELQIACPLLEDESCGIYSDRPLVCREYHVTSPAENCARIYEVSVDRVEVPLHMGSVLAQTAHKVADVPLQMIPLVLSLEWAESYPDMLKKTSDGLGMVQSLMYEIDQGFETDFDHRVDTEQVQEE